MSRQISTLEQAIAAENAPHNAWTDRARTPKYLQLRERARELPIQQRRGEFIELYKNSQVIIVEATTGSGKSTQIPQWCLYADHFPYSDNKSHRTGSIVATQPRRVAAVKLAHRVSDELDVDCGGLVGYSISGESKTMTTTLLRFCTDGLLLQRMKSVDKTLADVGCIILDDVHERTQPTDVLLMYLRTALLPKRPNLKLVVMSGTLNATMFSEYFSNAPILRAEGMPAQVTILHTPEPVPDFRYAAIRVVKMIHTTRMPKGDILIFMPGEIEVEIVASGIRHECPDLDVREMFGAMSQRAQKMSISGPKGKTRCIVATNVAETSLTLDGITYVIDSGLAKRQFYNPRTRLHILELGPSSVASATQRAGRVGRTQAGTVVRLYTRGHLAEWNYDLPGIQQGALHSTILALKALDMPPLPQVPWLSSPSPETLFLSWTDLYDLGCLDKDGKLTVLGRQASRLPLEVEHAIAVIEACYLGCAYDVADIVTLMECDPLFARPKGHIPSRAAAMRRKMWGAPHGDQLGLLNICRALRAEMRRLKKAGEEDKMAAHLDQWCKDRYLCWHSIEKAIRTRDSVIERLKGMPGLPRPENGNNNSENIRKALLRGMFKHIAVRKDDSRGNKNEQAYITVGENQPGLIEPLSALNDRRFTFIVYDKFTLAWRQYFETVFGINPRWLFDSERMATANNYFNALIALENVRLVRGLPNGRPYKPKLQITILKGIRDEVEIDEVRRGIENLHIH